MQAGARIYGYMDQWNPIILPSDIIDVPDSGTAISKCLSSHQEFLTVNSMLSNPVTILTEKWIMLPLRMYVNQQQTQFMDSKVDYADATMFINKSSDAAF